MSWLSACKEYAAKTGKWTVPKKDSPEYAEVKKIMDRLSAEKSAGAAAPEKPRPVLKVPAPVAEADKKSGITSTPKKSAAKKAGAEIELPPKRNDAGLKQAKKNARLVVEEEPSVVDAVLPAKKRAPKKSAQIVSEPVVMSFN